MYSNILDIVYCHTEEQSKELFDFYVAKGYNVGVSTVQINTGTLGDCVVKKLDIYKKKGEMLNAKKDDNASTIK